jgi:hypothetical protein
MDLRFGADMYESFVKYQGRLIKALDSMVEPYDFTVIDASQPIDKIFKTLQRHISRLKLTSVEPRRPVRARATKADANLSTTTRDR